MRYCSTRRDRSSKASKMQTIENNEKVILQYKIDTLVSEILAVKENCFMLAQNPTRKQLLPFQPSRPSPQKVNPND